MHHPTALIDPKAKLDEGVDVGPYSVIGPQVSIGSGSVIESHVIVRGPTKLGKNNHVFQFSTVGDGSPDCEIEDDVVLTNQAALAGAVKVGKGAILGGYAIVHQFCSIGAYSFCAMGSAVNKDIPAYVKVRGNPAKPHGINTVGLKRLGYSSKVIEALKSAYRSTYRKRLTVQEALEEIKPLAKKHKEVDLYYSTIKKATRGISR